MTIPAARFTGPSLAALAAVLAAGCSSGGGHAPLTCEPMLPAPAGTPFAPTGADCDATPAVPPGQPFTLSGTVTYDFVPARYDPATGAGGLDFGAAAQRPVRGAAVEIRQCATVLQTATTDENGRYTATFVPGFTGRVYVAVLARTADPPVQVQDNTDGDAVWAVATPLDAPTSTLDVRATHGWDGCAYGPWRIAGPFAILDDVYTAAHRLLALPRDVPFASFPLAVNWSPQNVPSSYDDPATGAIGTTHYDPALRQIFVLGADGIDTDEFDREVVVHEWGHYFTDTFSRADTTGGAHSFGWVLDPRTAFDEGLASALAAMLLQQTIYADTYWGPAGMDAGGWDVENAPSPTDDPSPGPFSELSVIRALWDLYDSGTNEPFDGAALGLAPIHDALVGPLRSSIAFTTIGSFIAGLKQTLGNVAATNAAIDGVLAHYDVGPITDGWGTGDVALRAIYTDVAAPTATPASLTATLSAFTCQGAFCVSWAWNERPQNQYFVFTASGTTATVTSTATQDVDLEAYHFGSCAGSTPCGLLGGAWGPTGNETISFATAPGEVYLVALTGWGGYDPHNPVPSPGTYTATLTFSSN